MRNGINSIKPDPALLRCGIRSTYNFLYPPWLIKKLSLTNKIVFLTYST